MGTKPTAHRMRRLAVGAGALLVGLGAVVAGAGIADADTDTTNGASRNSHSTRPARVAHHAALPARASATAQRSPATARSAAVAAPKPTYTAANPLPPRRQWLANDGYCGEESFVSAGLYYGQYISQYDARALAGRNAPQNTVRSQLLLGVNDVAAAKAMHLTSTSTTQSDTTSFLKWVKSNVAAGYPVAIGVYTNEFRFYGRTNPNAGDPEYDHIVTVTGVSSSSPLTGQVAYSADDIITFSDHGVWTGTPTGLPQYLFSYAFGAFPATRRQANAARGPVYSLPSGTPDYGIAITGVADLNHETVPVRVTTNVNAENPPMVNGATARPPARPVTLTVTVSNLKPGTSYNLYRYSSMAAVPESNFNANAAKATQAWKIVAAGPTYTVQQTIMSSEVAVYRAVPVTAR